MMFQRSFAFEPRAATPELLQAHLRGTQAQRCAPIKTLPPVLCADGTSLSVQASDIHGCSPRSLAGPYQTVELCCFASTFESDPGLVGEEMLPGVFVYRHVPLAWIVSLINAHGGMAS